MSYMDKSIEELHELLVSGKVTSDELVKESLSISHEIQDKCGYISEDNQKYYCMFCFDRKDHLIH